MDRRAIRELTHDAKRLLSLDNDTYKQWVFRYTFLELEKDLGLNGDITTEAIFPEDRHVTAKVVAKSDLVLSGRAEVEYFLVGADKTFRPRVFGDFKVDFNFEDGDFVSAGSELAVISGGVRGVLAVERVVLNLLNRMSSVATYTRKVVDLVADYDVMIAPTRKTLWGLLDKRAVVCGGGGTHRLSLSDAMIVKDNHFAFSDGGTRDIVKRLASKASGARFVEVEVDDPARVVEVCEIFKDLSVGGELSALECILLDNMSPAEVGDVLKDVKSADLWDVCLFEASGGITEENVVDYAKTGVDVISMGKLTASMSGVDIGLEV